MIIFFPLFWNSSVNNVPQVQSAAVLFSESVALIVCSH